MAGGRSGRGSRRQEASAPRSVVVPFPRGAAGSRLDLARFVPSGRSLLLTFGLVLAAGLAYWAAYATSVFAVERVDVHGAPPGLARQVTRVSGDLVGRSLVAIDANALEGELRALPAVAGVSVNRSFPHTLVVRIAPENPVAVVRRGHTAWLATGAGKVIREIEPGTQRDLPRLWIARGATLRLGGQVPAGLLTATRTLAEAHTAGLGQRVKGIRSTGAELTLAMRRGPEVRLGRPVDVRLKLTIARRVLALAGSDATYVDVSVPQRPVAG